MLKNKNTIRMRNQIMEMCSIYSWFEVKMNHDSLIGRTSAHLHQCSSCHIQHFWHTICNTGCGWIYPACTGGTMNVGLHHWPDWVNSPRMWFKEEIRTRDDHRWEMDWPQFIRVTSNNRNVRKTMWPNNSRKDAVLSKHYAMCDA